MNIVMRAAASRRPGQKRVRVRVRYLYPGDRRENWRSINCAISTLLLRIPLLFLSRAVLFPAARVDGRNLVSADVFFAPSAITRRRKRRFPQSPSDTPSNDIHSTPFLQAMLAGRTKASCVCLAAAA
jgi:hypothetical protein